MVSRTKAEPMPQNTSRAAGPPAPASVAATEPLYQPDREEPASQLAGTFNDDVRRDHEPLGDDGLTADRDAAELAAAEDRDAEEDLDAAIARIRATRKPLGAFSQKLALAKRPGYHRHWFNDSAGRIEEALDNGWAHVLGMDKKPVSRCVGSGRDKGALYAFAMEIPLVFWEEDQAVKNEAAMEVLNSVKRNVAQAAPGEKATQADRGKFYDPKDGDNPVQVKHTLHRA